MSALINKMLNLVGFDNEEELMEEEGYNSNTSNSNQENVKGNTNPFKKNSKVVNLSDANQLKLVVMQPNSFDDAQDVCDHLKDLSYPLIQYFLYKAFHNRLLTYHKIH